MGLKQKILGVSVKGLLALIGGLMTLGTLCYLTLTTQNEEALGAISTLASMIFGYYFGSETAKEAAQGESEQGG